jgi:hypothetical protein
MSDSSSDDDGPGFSSPVASDAESDSGDIFTYKAQRFQQKVPTQALAAATPVTTGRSKRRLVSTEDRLSRMDRKNKLQKESLQKAKLLQAKGDNSDDDSDIEVLETKFSPASKVRSSPPAAKAVFSPTMAGRMRTRSSPKAKSSSAAAAAAAVDLMNDSSDDEAASRSRQPLYMLQRQGASKEALDALQRSRMAVMNLQQAQQYHAEDIHVEVPADTIYRATMAASAIGNASSSYPSSTIATATTRAAAPAPSKPLGKTLRFTCRTKLEVNGKIKPSVQDKVLMVRENEPLSVLVDKFLKDFMLPPSARVTMTFDGQTLLASRTAASYEMEDEDLIDMQAKATAIPLAQNNGHNITTNTNSTNRTAASRTTTNRTNLGPNLSLTMRRQNGKKMEQVILKHKLNEPLQSLMETYKKRLKIAASKQLAFYFDGGKLNLQKSPATYEIENEDLIDVVFQ